LGLGYITQVSLPDIISKGIPADINWIQVACGNEHTLALAGLFLYLSVLVSSSIHLPENGEVWAWGANELGQLGAGHSKMVDRPTKVLSQEKYDESSHLDCFNVLDSSKSVVVLVTPLL
jgi:alpha-tubulin suppressor-like RCC1 family protein